jgi:pSer/pThr/pTyr-binding forkhead associated (FHA) protein
MNSFLNACGISSPLQLAVRGSNPGDGGVRHLHQPFALIGRDQRADVPLDHKLVSRRHVYLQVIEGQAFWIDLDSRSGTLSEGQPRKYGWLDAGKVIRIGPFELQRLMVDNPTSEARTAGAQPVISPLVARSHFSQPLPEVSLEFLNGPSRSACWPMNRVISLIGSAGGCKFRLADPSVSPLHCSLVRTPLGLWAVDLLSPDGIGVNDVLVRYALLADNDILRVGRYRIRIQSRFAARDQSSKSEGESRAVVTLFRDQQGDSPAAGLSGGITTFPGSHVYNPAVWPEPLSKALAPLQPAPPESGVEWTPTLKEPLKLERAELTASFLVPLVNQFGMMQQQMLDQFQQTISMLVQMFGTLQRDQMELIRDELDQLRELTKEFHSLKLELSTYTQAGASAPLLDRPTASRLSGESIAAAGGKKLRAGFDGATRPLPTSSNPAPAKASPVTSPRARREDPRSSRDAIDSPEPEQVNTASSQPRTGGPNPESERDVMVWLHQRVITLQQERETRWQKILKLLPGLS